MNKKNELMGDVLRTIQTIFRSTAEGLDELAELVVNEGISRDELQTAIRYASLSYWKLAEEYAEKAEDILLGKS